MTADPPVGSARTVAERSRRGSGGRIGAAAGRAAVTGAGAPMRASSVLGQVAHLDPSGTGCPSGSARRRAHLRPLPVAVTAVARVDDAFHARFRAIERSYCLPSVSRRRRRWSPIAVSPGGSIIRSMPPRAGEGAVPLVGRHDFTHVRLSICQAKSLGPTPTLETRNWSSGRAGIPVPPPGEVSPAQPGPAAWSAMLERVGVGARDAGAGRRRACRPRPGSCGPVSPGWFDAGRGRYPADPFGGEEFAPAGPAFASGERCPGDVARHGARGGMSQGPAAHRRSGCRAFAIDLIGSGGRDRTHDQFD